MQTFEWINTDLFRIIGWLIIHSLWQSFALLVILKLALLFVHKRRSSLRYILSVGAILAIGLCTAITFEYVHQRVPVTGVQALAGLPGAVGAASHAQHPGAKSEIAPATGSGLDLLSPLTAISPYLTLAWIIGLFIYTGKLLHSCLYLNKLRRFPGEHFPDAYRSLNELTEKMGITKSVKMIITSKVPEPLTFGHIRPVILVPFSYAIQVPPEQLEMILAHELSHIKRSDYAINLMQSIFEAMFFFNPFFNSISDIARAEREYCCDDMASTFTGNERTMAIALTNLKLLLGYPGLALSAAPVRSEFTQRVNRLINPGLKQSLLHPLSAFLFLLPLLLVVTKCTNTITYPNALPQPATSIRQIFSDNQADHKIEVFSYSTTDRSHDLLLVSTIDGTPLYAYLDGNHISGQQLSQLHTLISLQRTISPEQLLNQGLSPKELRINRAESLQNHLTASSPDYSVRTGELRALAMQDYDDDTKNISVDVQLHDLLTRIIRNTEYTTEERTKLTALLNKRT